MGRLGPKGQDWDWIPHMRKRRLSREELGQGRLAVSGGWGRDPGL